MAKKVDAPSRWADLLTKALFTGKRAKKFGISKAEAKKFTSGLASYMTATNPPLGPGSIASQDIIRQLSAPGGLIGQSQGLLQNAIGTQQAMLPSWQRSVEQGLGGNFFDIDPMRATAERELMTQTRPLIGQTFATLDAPLSSDLTGQMVGAKRDMELDLAAQDALMEFQAKNALVNQGGLTAYMQGAQQPYTLAQGGLNQYTQTADALASADALNRAAQMSTQPGAAGLFPSFVSGGLDPMSQISSRGRTIAEV